MAAISEISDFGLPVRHADHQDAFGREVPQADERELQPLWVLCGLALLAWGVVAASVILLYLAVTH